MEVSAGVHSVDDIFEEGLEEAVDPMSRRQVARPSVKEIRDHRTTHLPFRDWCLECVAGRAKDWPHQTKEADGPLSVPEIHMDYCFLRNRKGEDYQPVLVGKDRESKLFFAHVVPCKGGDTEWVVKQICRDLKRLGIHGDVKLIGDQEPAIQQLFREVAQMRGTARTIIEPAPKGDSKGNGLAERAVQSVEEMVRVLKLALESRIGKQLQVSHLLFTWLVEHAVDILNKFVVGRDGKSAFERLKGKKYHGMMVEFASPVMFRVSGKVEGGVMTDRWYEGIWLGKRFDTEEHLVMKGDGLVVRCRAVRERDIPLTLDELDKLQCSPWDPTGTSKPADSVPRASIQPEEHENPSAFRPRRVMITKEAIEKFGTTVNCARCRALARGENARTTNHSEECRLRMEARMSEDAAFKDRMGDNSIKRDRYLAEQIEKTVDKSEDMTDDPPAEGGNGASSSSSGQNPNSAAPQIPDSAVATDDMDADIDVPLATEELVEPQEKRSRLGAVYNDSCYDVCEGFSPPRMTVLAEKNGLRPGWSLDVTCKDVISGRQWDLTQKREQQKFLEMRKRDRPQLLGMSPPCTLFSILQNLRKTQIPAEEMEAAREMLRIAMKGCKKQHQDGLYFFHEHPKSASSWKEPEVLEVLAMLGVITVDLDMCRFGLKACDQWGEGLAMKPTRIMTNMSCAPLFLEKKCCG